MLPAVQEIYWQCPRWKLYALWVRGDKMNESPLPVEELARGVVSLERFDELRGIGLA